MKTITSILVLMLLVAGAMAAEDALAPAAEAFQAGNYEQVLTLCAAVSAESEDYPRALYLGGEAHLSLGQYEAAETAFKALAALRPKAVAALVGMGRSQLGLGRAEDAVKTLRGAVKADRRDLCAQRALGEALAAAGQPKEAASILTKAFDGDRKSALTGRALVAVLLGLEATAEAGSAARKLVKAAPENPMGYFLMGLALDREGKSDEAIAAYEQALAKDDAFLDAHKNLAILCHTANPLYRDTVRTKKALQHYARYFELGGQDPELERSYLQMKGFLESMGGD
jgi:tetratricopeptide (TPR) repeat protein